MQREAFTAAGLPVLSLDSKKKELIGNFKNAGVAWGQEAQAVNTYDFPSDAEYRASIHGIHDVARNPGHGGGGPLGGHGRVRGGLPGPLVAGGGAGGPIPTPGRFSSWPTAAAAMGIVRGSSSGACSSSPTSGASPSRSCHFATGASKWNPIEHQLFSYISINWAAQPLRSTDTLLRCIRGTTTTTGLRVRAWFCTRTYQTKIKITNAQMESVCLRPLPICPAWSYTISPSPNSRGP